MIKQIVLVFFFVVNLFSSQLSWYGEYDTALHVAKKEHKDLMVLVIQEDSQAAISVLKQFFMNQSYLKDINQNFISVLVTYEKSSYPVEMLYTTQFPRLFFISSDDEVLLSNPFKKTLNFNK